MLLHSSFSDDDKKRERTKRREFLKEAEKLSPEERDIRTVFCMQLAKGIREEDLEDFFSPAGTVVDVRLISDRNSRRSKGIAYVEFKTPDSLPKVSDFDQEMSSVVQTSDGNDIYCMLSYNLVQWESVYWLVGKNKLFDTVKGKSFCVTNVCKSSRISNLCGSWARSNQLSTPAAAIS